MKGKVVRLMQDKGFGFIRGEDGREYFVHRSAFKNADFADVDEGREVEFEDSEGLKGLRAEDVYV